jgi:hypothetical protein
MDALERVTVLITLMQRLGQVMDGELAVLRGMRPDTLADVQQEKQVLAEVYEIELRRLRGQPEVVVALDPAARAELFEAMRRFQDRLRANRLALEAAREVVERVHHAIRDELARASAPGGYGGGEPRGQVISLALDREI